MSAIVQANNPSDRSPVTWNNLTTYKGILAFHNLTTCEGILAFQYLTTCEGILAFPKTHLGRQLEEQASQLSTFQ